MHVHLSLPSPDWSVTIYCDRPDDEADVVECLRLLNIRQLFLIIYSFINLARHAATARSN
jgi:hypothetical protein